MLEITSSKKVGKLYQRKSGEKKDKKGCKKMGKSVNQQEATRNLTHTFLSFLLPAMKSNQLLYIRVRIIHNRVFTLIGRVREGVY